MERMFIILSVKIAWNFWKTKKFEKMSVKKSTKNSQNFHSFIHFSIFPRSIKSRVQKPIKVFN